VCGQQGHHGVQQGRGGEVGAARLTAEVLDIMVRLPAAVETLTGVNASQVTPPRRALTRG